MPTIHGREETKGKGKESEAKCLTGHHECISFSLSLSASSWHSFAIPGFIFLGFCLLMGPSLISMRAGFRNSIPMILPGRYVGVRQEEEKAKKEERQGGNKEKRERER